ncbi:MAG: rhodanese-like domain-containing protein [Pelovirga sp.]
MTWSKGVLLLLLIFALQCLTLNAFAEEKISGQVKAVSRKAQTIQVEVGDGSQMVKFDDDTEGMEFIKVGEAAIIEYENVGADRIARVIKPRLVKLPEGTSEVTNDEVARLVALGPEQGNYYLVDSRPPARYAEGHVPTAVSIPVPLLEKNGAELLPADKDTLLIFYCGGPT